MVVYIHLYFYNPNANYIRKLIVMMVRVFFSAFNCLGIVNDTDLDGICDSLEIFGCTDQLAINFDNSATEDDGSCMFIDIFGCTNPSAINFNPSANVDDGTCQFNIYGCTDSTAVNFNPIAITDDGSCCLGDLLEIEMFDSWGDGWNNNILRIFDSKVLKFQVLHYKMVLTALQIYVFKMDVI